MARQSKYSPEVRERAVRLFRESVAQHPSEWAALQSIASKIGCNTETLRIWVRRTQVDSGERAYQAGLAMVDMARGRDDHGPGPLRSPAAGGRRSGGRDRAHDLLDRLVGQRA